MKWKVVYTSQARQDLRNIFQYIANELLVPETAANQVERILKGIRNLDEMPLRFPLYEKEPWNSRGLRYFPVNYYIIYYLLDEDVGTVNIVRIIYGGRDISKQLNEEVSDF